MMLSRGLLSSKLNSQLPICRIHPSLRLIKKVSWTKWIGEVSQMRALSDLTIVIMDGLVPKKTELGQDQFD